ncbi:MAG: hypothetical protein H6727_16355 [Myxococcales bacterium]|nr:hypothetical protein [Myxococcales bacterium]
MDRKQEELGTASNQEKEADKVDGVPKSGDTPAASATAPEETKASLVHVEDEASTQDKVAEEADASDEKKNKPRGGFLRASQDDDEEIARMLRDIRNDREGTFPPAVRYLGYGLSFFTLIALGIMTIVMVRDVRFASQIYGPKKLLAGERATFRVAIFEAESTEFLHGVQATFWLVDGKKEKKIFHGETAQDVLIANLRVPRWSVGKYQLRIRVQGPKGEETLNRPVEVIPPNLQQGRFAKENSLRLWQSSESSTAPYRVRFFAEGRALVPDLNNYVYVWVQQRKSLLAPIKAPSTQPKSPSTPKIPASPRATSLPVIPSSRPTSLVGLRPAPSSQPSSRVVLMPTSRPIVAQKKAQPTPTKHPLHRMFGSPESRRKRGDLLNPFAEPPTHKAPQPAPPAKTESWVAPNHRVWLEMQEGSARLGPFPARTVSGIIRFPYMPQFFRVSWDAVIWGRLGKAEQNVQMKTEGYQLTADPKEVLLSPQGELTVRVDSLLRTAPLHIDLVQGGRRLWSTQRELREGRSVWKVKIPKDIQGLISVQVYSEFYFPGEVYDTRLLYVGKASEAEIRKALRKHLLRRGDGMRILDVEEFPAAPATAKGLEVWARTLFSLVKGRFTPPALLYDSSKDRLHSLRRYQHDFRRRTLMMLGGLGAFVLLGMFLWMFLGYRRDQQRMNDFAKEEDIHVKSRGIALIFVAILVVSMIFASILFLFWSIQWKYDNM